MKLIKLFSACFFILCCSALFAETKASYYKKYLKENPFNFVNSDLPRLSDVKSNPVSFSFVKENLGYYIQNQKRSFQQGNRSTIIFKLYESDGKFFLSQIDVKNGAEVILSQSELVQSGNFIQTSDSIYRIARNQNALYIFDSASTWKTKWAYTYPFTLQADLSGLKDCTQIMKMTSDYLKKFEGTYYIDSYITSREGSNYRKKEAPAESITVSYDEKAKALKWNDTYFIETDFSDPFYWIYGEGAGYIETINTFADNGILHTQVEKLFSCGDDDSYDIQEDCYFYKKSSAADF